MDDELHLLKSVYEFEILHARMVELWQEIEKDTSDKFSDSSFAYFGSPREYPAIAQIVFAEVDVELKRSKKRKLKTHFCSCCVVYLR